MANPGNYNLPEDSRLDGIIQKLEQRIADLEKARSIGTTSVDGGAFEVKTVDGKLLWVFGDIAKAGVINKNTGQPFTRPDGSTQMGVVAFRDSGECFFQALDNQTTNDYPYKQNWGFFDVKGNRLLGDDVASGTGLARPYLPLSFISYDTTVWGTTQSATYVDMVASTFNLQHPKLYMDVLMYCDTAGTTGQMQLALNGTAFGPVVSGSQGYTSYSPAIQAWPSGLTMGQFYTLTVQAQRTGGTGNVKIAVRGAWGVQT